MSDSEIRKLIDEAEIRNLVGKLAIMADLYEDLEEYYTYWTQDATFDMREPVGWKEGDKSQAWIVKGLDELKANRKQLREVGFQGPGSNVWHANTTLFIDVKDEANAEAQSYWVLLGSSDSVQLLRVGHYHDTFRKTDGKWKLAYRRVTPGLAGAVPPKPDEG